MSRRAEKIEELLAIVAQLDDAAHGERPSSHYAPGRTRRNRFGKLTPSQELHDRLRQLFRSVGGRSGGTDFCDQLAHTAQHIMDLEG